MPRKSHTFEEILTLINSHPEFGPNLSNRKENISTDEDIARIEAETGLICGPQFRTLLKSHLSCVGLDFFNKNEMIIKEHKYNYDRFPVAKDLLEVCCYDDDCILFIDAKDNLYEIVLGDDDNLRSLHKKLFNWLYAKYEDTIEVYTELLKDDPAYFD